MSHYFFDREIDFDILEENKAKRKVKAHDGRLMLVEVYNENGAEGYKHSHPHEQCCYCIEGEFTFTMLGETLLIKAGDSVYIPPNVEHGTLLKSKTGRLLDVFTPMREDFLK